MTTCTACKEKTAKSAETCPHCGRDIAGERAGACLGTGCLILVALTVVVLLVGYLSSLCA